jgi:hypothetical protein
MYFTKCLGEFRYHLSARLFHKITLDLGESGVLELGFPRQVILAQALLSPQPLYVFTEKERRRGL